jgi:hypothetical protein
MGRHTDQLKRELVLAQSVLQLRNGARSMIHGLKRAVRRGPNYSDVLGVVAMLLGIAIIVGIVYTYADSRRLSAGNDIGARIHALENRKLPADL